jgi:acyl-CoA thioesterase
MNETHRAKASPHDLARRAAAAMFTADRAARAWGIGIDRIEPGQATVSMTVREDMLNGHGICHGGLIFSLADTAFAYACNSYNQVALAQNCAITFLAKARAGDRLQATAAERAREGRNGIYDVRVTNQDGAVIAEFRGASRTVGGHLVADK